MVHLLVHHTFSVFFKNRFGMRKIFVFIFLLLASLPEVQGRDAFPKKGIPPFTVLLTSRNYYSYKDLERNKPSMIIYFAPDCEHCRNFTKKLLDSFAGFKKIQIVMVSYFPIVKLQQFNKEFMIYRFSNIKLGTEGNAFVVPSYFKILKFPFVALFDKNGNEGIEFRETPSVKVLSDFVKKLL